MKSVRRLLVLVFTVPLLMSAVMVLPAQADECGVTIDPCRYGDVTQVSRIEITAMAGVFDFRDCAISALGHSCTDAGFDLAAYGPAGCSLVTCTRGCTATEYYVDPTRSPVTNSCSISDGSGAEYGHGTAVLDDTQGCARFSYYPSSSDPTQAIYFTDALGIPWNITSLSWTSTGGAQVTDGTQWVNNTLTMTGQALGTDGFTHSLGLTLSGSLHSTKFCASGDQVKSLFFSSFRGTGLPQ